MIDSVLLANPVADVCYLQEALYWLTLHRFPISAGSLYASDDGREDQEWISILAPNLARETPSRSECEFSGLPPHPISLQILEDEYIPSKRLEKWLLTEKDSNKRAVREAEIARARIYEDHLKTWQVKFESELDKNTARLFLALRTGKISSTGKRIENGLLNQLIGLEREREVEYAEHGIINHDRKIPPSPNWDEVDREVISEEFWVSGNIGWSYSCSRGIGHGYALVLIKTAELFNEFPIPEARQLRQVSQIGDTYVLLDQEGNPTAPAEGQAGRKPFPWDDFHLEIARRIYNHQLTSKQESMISEMQAWCHAKWGKMPARSTVSQKLKPYFDEFIRN